MAGSVLVAPFGARDRRFSTAPFAAGVPRPDGEPIILDFATSAVAEGKVLVAARGGKPLPAGSLIDGEGLLTADPDALYGPMTEDRGAGRPQGRGRHPGVRRAQGSGLALMCELLAGALTGSGCCGPGPRRFCNGMLSIYLAPAAFGPQDAFAAEVRDYLAYFGSARPAERDGRCSCRAIRSGVSARNASRTAFPFPTRSGRRAHTLSVCLCLSPGLARERGIAPA